MSVIATAAIKVTAETGDLKGKLDDGSRSLRNFGGAHADVIRSADGHTLALGRIERALGSYVGHVVGANHVTEQLGVALGSFSAGGIIVTGVLLGIAAIVGAYELLTASTKKAEEEQKKLAEALAQQFLPKTGPRSTTNLEFEAALKRRADLTRHLGFLENASSDAQVARNYTANGEAAPFLSRDKEIAAVTADLAKVNQAIQDAYAGSISKMTTVTVTARNMEKVAKDALSELTAEVKAALGIFDILKIHGESSSTVNKGLIADYNQVSEQIRNMGKEASPAKAALMQLREELAANLVVMQAIAREASTGTVGPLVGKVLPGVIATYNGALTDAQQALNHTPNVGNKNAFRDPAQIAIENQTAQDAAHAQLLEGAIRQSAATIASVVGQAILRVGNSRGSQIGGALGGAIGGGIGAYYGGLAATAVGGVLGAAVGSVVPVVGTIVGGFLGSAIGGLFSHHKKSVDSNTAAIQALTQAMQVNTPSGYKVDLLRFDSTVSTIHARRPVPGGIVVQGDLNVSTSGGDIKSLQRDIRIYATRGGARMLTAA